MTKALPGVVDRAEPRVLRDALRLRAVRDELLLVVAYAMLNFPLALVCVKTSVAQLPPQLADVARSLGRGPVSGLHPRHAAAARAGAARRVLPRVPDRGDRADGDARARPDRRPDTRDAVLGVPAERRLRRRGAVRAGDGRARAGPRSAARAVVRPRAALAGASHERDRAAGSRQELRRHRRAGRRRSDGPDRSITAVLGASGSGKTTLLRLIAGFERLDGGSLRSATGWSTTARGRCAPQHRGVGYVPQEGALFPHLTARQRRASVSPRATARKAERAARARRAAELAQALPAPALRRPAAARRAGAGARDRPARGAARRAVQRAGCVAARRAAPRRGADPVARPAPPRSSSPTTRTRRWRSPTRSRSWPTGACSPPPRRARSTATRRTPGPPTAIGEANLLRRRDVGRHRPSAPRLDPGRIATGRRRPTARRGC